MQGDEARLLLGFPPNSRPTPSQVKAAYKRKVWESHPDRFPVHEKPNAESKFKLGEKLGQLGLYGACRRRFALGEDFHCVKQANTLVMLESLVDDWIVETEKHAGQEDEEILYSEMKNLYGNENDENEKEDANAEAKHAETVMLAGVVEPVEVNPAAVDANTDDDDCDFLDDDLTD